MYQTDGTWKPREPRRSTKTCPVHNDTFYFEDGREVFPEDDMDDISVEAGLDLIRKELYRAIKIHPLRRTAGKAHPFKGGMKGGHCLRNG